MVQGRAAGNGNFDIDAITRLVNADANAPAVMDQPFIDPAADAFAADVQETADQIRYNPGSSLVEEAAQLMNAPGAAKLGAGVMADLRAAVQLQEEKAANGADAFMRGDRVWEERKERDDKDRKEQARIADFAEDAQNSQLSTTPDRYGLSQQNYSDLNDELKTRDGQERFMNFMRMLHPELSDAQIRQRLDIANAIAAERSGRGNADTRRVLEAAPPSLVNDVTGDMAQYQQMDRRSPAPSVANRVDAQATGLSANAASSDPQATTGASLNLLSGGTATDLQATTSSLLISRVSVSAQVDGQAAISGAPSLRGQFGAALTATTPLDAPQLATATAAPPPPAPAATATSGFDV